MNEINDKEECIEIKEYLTFNGTVQPVYDKFIERATNDLEIEGEPGSNFSEANKKLKEIVEYELTHYDKLEILQSIIDKFNDSCDDVYNVSIFDEDIIKAGIENWIGEKFEYDLTID